MTLTAKTQPRQSSGKPTGGRFASAARPDEQNAGHLSIETPLSAPSSGDKSQSNPVTATYAPLRRGEPFALQARVRKSRVSFHLDENGWWSATSEKAQILMDFKELTKDYWKNWRERKPDIAIWGGAIVCDMLNKGEISPRGAEANFPEGPQVALTAAYTIRKRKVGRHALSAALARTRSAQMLLSHKVTGVTLGGEKLNTDGKDQARHNLRVLEDAFVDIPESGPQFGVDRTPTDANGVYFGEDQRLALKVLTEQVGDHSALHMAVEQMSKDRPGVTAANVCLYGVLHDDSIRESMLSLSRHDSDAMSTTGGIDRKHTALNTWMSKLQSGMANDSIPRKGRQRLAELALETVYKADSAMCCSGKERIDLLRHVRQADLMNCEHYLLVDEM